MSIKETAKITVTNYKNDETLQNYETTIKNNKQHKKYIISIKKYKKLQCLQSIPLLRTTTPPPAPMYRQKQQKTCALHCLFLIVLFHCVFICFCYMYIYIYMCIYILLCLYIYIYICVFFAGGVQ